jgi:hypothetical protein
MLLNMLGFRGLGQRSIGHNELGGSFLPLRRDRGVWRALFGHSAPKSLRRSFLARAVAYQMQVEVYGGLPVPTKRRLREIANAVRNGDANAVAGSVRIKPGTQMLRQWQDTTHTVTAAEGFEWNGRTYKSLSASHSGVGRLVGLG